LGLQTNEKDGKDMNDKTSIRITGIVCGTIIICVAAIQKVDSLLYIFGGFLIGFPIDKILEKVKSK